MKKLFLLFAVITIFWTGTVSATNITISDNNYDSGKDWHNDVTQGWFQSDEDNEVEPGMEHGQKWDLEGFFLQGSKLSLVGGYDFLTAESDFASGDIFIDVDGDAVYGEIDGNKNENISVQKTYGYEYVLDLDIENKIYNIFAINEETSLLTAFYKQNQGSSPWRYESGGTPLSTGTGVKLEYNAKTTAYDDIFSSIETHNEVVVDLSFLSALGLEGDFIAHYTMGCGNDNLMGQGTIPNPEPATMLLLGFGLIGIAGLARKKQS